MVKINVCDVDDCDVDGLLKCETNLGPVTINLPGLGEDGVLLRDDGVIEVGGARPSIEFYTDNPPRTSEVFINITGWFYIHFRLVIEVKDGFTYVAVLDK